eukprot:15214-Heterococcus_DN1.PRE.2
MPRVMSFLNVLLMAPAPLHPLVHPQVPRSSEGVLRCALHRVSQRAPDPGSVLVSAGRPGQEAQVLAVCRHDQQRAAHSACRLRHCAGAAAGECFASAAAAAAAAVAACFQLQ